MLFQSLRQSQIFIIIMYFGMICGLVFQLCSLLKQCIKIKFAKSLIDFCFVATSGLFFVFLTNLYNYGIFRIFMLVSYILGAFLVNKTIGYYFQKLIIMIYTYIVNFVKKVCNTKFAKKLFKWGNMSNDTFRVLKYITISILTLCSVILILEYVIIFQIKSDNAKLKNELEIVCKKNEQLSSYNEYLQANKDYLSDNYFREEKDMVKNGETIINYNA